MFSRPVLVVLQKTLPIIKFLKDYTKSVILEDLIAGFTLGLTLIPQSIAYASLAGLPPQYGLYSSLVGGFTYAVFGTIPELNIAPTALLSLLTFQYTNKSQDPIQLATLLCLLSGLIELASGVLHLGFLVDFVSIPVVAAFTSAGALTIASSQIKNLLGVTFNAETFFGVWKHVFATISQTKGWDLFLGLSCCVILLALRKLKDLGGKAMKKPLWFVSVARNAFVVVACATLAFILMKNGHQPFQQTSKVPAGWPSVAPPNLYDLMEKLKEMGSGVVVVPFVAILGNVAIAKAFAKGKVVDASQEMMAVGLCNILGSFFGSFPVNASFSRAALASASGGRTPLSGIYTGLMVMLAFTFLTPFFSYIPKATLAAVIICAVIFMVEIRIVKLIWNLNKLDLIPFTITFVVCLITGIEYGILVGVLIDIIVLLYYSARPKLTFETFTYEQKGFKVITPSSSIRFPSAEYLRETALKSSTENTVLVLNCDKITNLDFTAIKCIGVLFEDLKKNNIQACLLTKNLTISSQIKMTSDDQVTYFESMEQVKCHYLKDSNQLTISTNF